jgi:hypothetical protein
VIFTACVAFLFFHDAAGNDNESNPFRVLWLPAPLLCGLLIRLTAHACMLLRLAYQRLFVSLTVASCSAYLWLFDQAYCRLFVSLTVASCPAYL